MLGEYMDSTITALQSLDGSNGVSFHMFSLAEERCLYLLVNDLRKRMLESVVREEMANLGASRPGNMQHLPRRRDQERLLIPPFIV